MAIKETIAEIDIDVTDFTETIRAKVKAALRQAIAQYKRKMRAWIEENKNIPVATGHLKESGIEALYESTVVDTGFKAVFGFLAEYAKYVDEGRTAAYPPIAEIRAWCMTVGIPEKDAVLIAWHLSHHATPGKHFFEPGVIEAKRVLQETLIVAFAVQGLEATIRI